MFPGRVILGIGTGESLNEVPSTAMVWPEFKERFARHARIRDADPPACGRRRPRELRGPVLPDRESATIYDKPTVPVPIYVAAAGALVAKYAGRQGDGFICTSGKAWDLYTADAAAECGGRSEGLHRTHASRLTSG